MMRRAFVEGVLGAFLERVTDQCVRLSAEKTRQNRTQEQLSASGGTRNGLAPPLSAAEMAGATALSGDRFTAGGAEYLLADIVAPPIYTLSEGDQPYFSESKAALQALFNAGPITLRAVLGPNRWGARAVIAESDEGAVLQSLLVEMGAVRVAPQSDELTLIGQLLTLEAKARSPGAGLWRHERYKIRDANDAISARAAIGAFHILEGRVVSAAKTRGRAYLNFGDDYRTDFTASAQSRIARAFARDGLDLAGLEGRLVRVRGFVEDINGPSIEMTHIRQIELIAEP